MDGVELTALKIISDEKGDIMHALKRSESSCQRFGEAYFSTVSQGAIKGWKKHSEMILNLIVVCGEIRFVVCDDLDFFSITLSKKNYYRLTIDPGKWLAFQGLGQENILLNVASIEHNPLESEILDLDEIPYDW